MQFIKIILVATFILSTAHAKTRVDENGNVISGGEPAQYPNYTQRQCDSLEFCRAMHCGADKAARCRAENGYGENSMFQGSVHSVDSSYDSFYTDKTEEQCNRLDRCRAAYCGASGVTRCLEVNGHTASGNSQEIKINYDILYKNKSREECQSLELCRGAHCGSDGVNRCLQLNGHNSSDGMTIPGCEGGEMSADGTSISCANGKVFKLDDSVSDLQRHLHKNGPPQNRGGQRNLNERPGAQTNE